jgi:hypothetical protein
MSDTVKPNPTRPGAAYITGANIVVDGGQTLGIPGTLEG